MKKPPFKKVAKSAASKSKTTRARARTESREVVVVPVGDGGHQIMLAPVDDLPAYAKNARKHPAEGNVIEASRTGNQMHPTQKPVDLLVSILNVTPGDVVYDPFTGSGSTLMACIGADDVRTFYGCELSPGFADVVVKRWQAHTGETATLAATGETFAEVEAKRGKATKR